VDAAYEQGKREAESLVARKQHQLSTMLSNLQEINESLATGRQWLSDYMEQQQQAGCQSGDQAGQSVSAKLEVITLSVLYRDVMRRAHAQIDPTDEVHPRMNLQDMDDDAFGNSLTGLFHVTDSQVP
jgi:hypothetical protein